MSLALLNNADTSGVYYLRASRRAEIESACNHLQFEFLPADIGDFSSTGKALQQLGSDLKFPSWYGANFDALFDCLADPEWQPAKGHVLLINGMARLRLTNPGDFVTLIEVFQSAARSRREMPAPAPFWILIDTPARGIPTFPEK